MSVDERVRPLGSSRCDLRRSEEEEEDELRMLATLKREQEEEQNSDMGGLTASQVKKLCLKTECHVITHYVTRYQSAL